MSRLRLVMLGLLAAFAVGAVASASASASLEWFICNKPGGSIWLYTDSLCTKDSTGKTGAWELSLLARGTSLNITSSGGPFILKSKTHGIKLEIECSTQTGSGRIENPTGGGNGIDLATIEFKTCTMPKPGENCMIKEPITTNANTELITLGGKTLDLFTPDPAGQPFAELEILGCTGGAAVLNASGYKIQGKTSGAINNSTSTLTFGAEMDELTFAGEPAGFEGKSTQLTDGGGGIQAF